MRHRNDLLRRRSLLVLFAVMFCGALAGCRHAPQATSVIRLQHLEMYPLLQPEHASDSRETLEQTQLRLGRVKASRVEACSIAGTTFSLAAPVAGAVWTLRSPSMAGWDDASITSNARAAWIAFVRELDVRRLAGCFPRGVEPLRLIAESMTTPADEATLYRYVFTGDAATVLVPGMLLVVEHVEAHGNVPVVDSTRYVVAASGRGVLFHRTSTKGARRWHLDDAMRGYGDLRVFLQNATYRDSLLVGANDPVVLDRAVVALTEHHDCAALHEPQVRCVVVDGAVSLMVAVRVDGKLTEQPLGMNLGALLDGHHVSEYAKVQVLRRLSGGRWARVEFPGTRAGASRVVLVDGDLVTTR